MSKSVYLAGGMKDGWQDEVIGALRGWVIYDPRAHGLTNPADYTQWDLEHIRAADVVVAYIDSMNPSGYGMSIEIGYAHALGKPIVLIDRLADWRGRYWDMARQVCVVVKDTSSAIERLEGTP